MKFDSVTFGQQNILRKSFDKQIICTSFGLCFKNNLVNWQSLFASEELKHYACRLDSLVCIKTCSSRSLLQVSLLKVRSLAKFQKCLC